jgi:hypothetical protein
MAAERGVVNLEGRAQNLQIRVGVVTVAMGLGAALAMNGLHIGLGMHLLLVPVLFIGAYGVCAGLSGTCALTAIFGRRLTATGPEPIADRAELAALRRRGAGIMATSLLLSVLATALLCLLSR